MGMNGRTYQVIRTVDRECKNDYQIQLSPNQLNEGVLDIDDGDLVQVSNLEGTLTVHAQVYGHQNPSDDEAGVDFTLRYALGVAAEEDIWAGIWRRNEYGAVEPASIPDRRIRDCFLAWLDRIRTDESDRVRVEPVDGVDRGYKHKFFDWLLGVRTEVCRVRMAVHPDLENDVCRIPETTMELIGIEEGDSVVIESTDEHVDGIKALTLDEEIRERKERQRVGDPQRYVNCYEELDLHRIRATGEDIPEIFLDAEVREHLGIVDVGVEGVCQPVRVYRDTMNVLVRHLHTLLAPMALVFIGAAIKIRSFELSIGLLIFAAILSTAVLVYQGRRLLR